MKKLRALNSLVTRVLVVATLSVVTVAGLVGTTFLWRANLELREREQVDLRDEIKLHKDRLSLQLTQLRLDVLALRTDASVNQLLDRANEDQPDGDLRKEVEDVFKNICRLFPAGMKAESANGTDRQEYLKPYLQVRLIDRDGREIAVVLRNDPKPGEYSLTVEDHEALDDPHNDAFEKSDKRYFKETVKLTEKAAVERRTTTDSTYQEPVYLSPIEPNHDKTKKRVHQEQTVVRAASPIVDKENRFLGLIIINFDFNEATSQLVNSPRHLVYLMEADGAEASLLYHPDYRNVDETFRGGANQDARARLQSDFKTDITTEMRAIFRTEEEQPEYVHKAMAKRRLEHYGVGLPMGGGTIELSDKKEFWLMKLSVTPDSDAQQKIPLELQDRRADGKLPDGFRGPMGGLSPSATSFALRADSYDELKHEAERLIDEHPNLLRPQYTSTFSLFDRVHPLRCRNFTAHYFRIYFDPQHPSRHIGLLMGFSKEELQADLWPIARWCFWVGAGVTVGIIGVVFVLMRRFVKRPLDQLTHAAEQIGNGNFNAPLPLTKSDEIGHLARTFNQMIGQIRSREEDVAKTTLAVQDREARLRAIFDTAADGVVTLDGDYKIQAVNPAAIEMFGRSRGALRDKPVVALIKEEDHQRLQTAIEEMSQDDFSRTSLEVTAIQKTKNGARHFSVRISIGKAAGNAFYALVFTDITKEKQTHEMLEDEVATRTRELEIARDVAVAAEQASDKFIANVNHELRNPLHQISSNCQRLQRKQEKYGPLTTLQAEIVSKIRKSVEKLVNLISDVIDLEKIKVGLLPLEVERFELRPFLNSLLDGIREGANSGGNEIEVIGVEKLDFIATDRKKLDGILTNLMTNACKFTQEGKITMEVFSDTDRIMSVRVTDTGLGMTQDQQDHLFERFRTNRDPVWNPDGIGLGLVHARGLAEQLGGHLELVHSEVGKGTTFIATIRDDLPLTKTPEQGANDRERPSKRSSTERREKPPTILVIDDDDEAADVLRDLLDEGHLGGLKIVSALTGTEGLEKAKQCQPDLILLDIKLPGIDGWSVLAALKTDDELKHIPVVPLTIVDDQPKARALGASDYLLKPIDADNLNKVIHSYCSGTPTILIVDDDAEDRATMREAMESSTFGILEAENGLQALERIAEQIPDLILLDLKMPEMGGAELLVRLNEDPATPLTDPECVEVKDLVEKMIQKGAIDEQKLVTIIRRALAVHDSDPEEPGGL